jgi:uncharacterized membrane protein
MKITPWVTYALLSTVFCGAWGALIELPEKSGFPATLGYIVWALTMILPAAIALKRSGKPIERSKTAIWYGMIIGISGAAGQLILFQALRSGPAYLVFPFVSLSPLVTILLSIVVLKEKASTRAWIGIVVALIAIPMLSYQPHDNSGPSGFAWIILALLVFLLWGVQGYFMKVANEHMQAESIFFYMMVAGIALIPAAVLITDLHQPINWGFKGPPLAALIQVLNAFGALFLVYAFRYGRAIIVSPLTNAGAPMITIVLSLLLYGVFPHSVIIAGLLLAIFAVFLLAL